MNSFSKNFDWKNINKKDRPDRLKPNDLVRAVHKTDGTILFGVITYENDRWREIQIDHEFFVCSFFEWKFYFHRPDFE